MKGLATIAAAAVLATASPPQDARPLNLVWFAGGGGSSEGMAAAGFKPDYALNHNATALLMHQVNHPGCVHLCDDAQAVHPLTLEPGRRIGVFWASPDCTHFSIARGGAPKSPRIRGLAWCVIPWAKLRRPDVIFLENVKEFQTWGPLYPEGHMKAGQPIPKRKGETFRRWVRRLEACGYQVEFRVLCAADYGAPTTRRRLFMIARCDGEAIVWPARTHAPRKEAAALGLKPYESAASIIDWSERCPSIFMTQAEARAEGLNVKRPLVAATQRRIFKGLERYVIGSPEPFIVPVTHHGERRPLDPREPLPTVTAANRGELAAVAPTITPILNKGWRPDVADDAGQPLRTITAAKGGEFAATAAYLVPRYGERDGQAPRSRPVSEPYPTAVPGGNGGGLVVANVTKFQENSIGQHPLEPVDTVMAGATRFGVVAATLGRQFGSTVAGNDIREPSPTIMGEGGGGKMQVIAASLTSYYNTGVGSDAGEPLRTATGEDRHAVTAAFLEQANTGVVGHDARDGLSTVTGRGTQQRVIEARLERMGASPGSRRRQVLEFLWAHAGRPTDEDWADPTGSLQARVRFGLVVIAGQVWEIADIGMRMLTPRELFNAQGFRRDYIIDRDAYGGRITGTAATLMVGNSVPPPLAEALCAANLNDPEPMRAAA